MDGTLPHGTKGKRDEWSEGGVLSLLEIYESKWLFRNRAKLKGSDWEDIARQVSIQYSSSNAHKTPSQCKNKIESMKKRYRAEAAAAAENPGSCSSWQFFARMDGLLKAAATLCPSRPNSNCNRKKNVNLVVPGKAEEVDADAGDGNLHERHREHGSNSSGKGFVGEKFSDEVKESGGSDSDVSARMFKEEAADDRILKKRRRLGNEMAESIQLLAQSILKIEQGRMEMFRDSEKLRAEAEIKKWEMELKRTEIISKTQLQIAKIVMKRLYGKSNAHEGSPLKTELDMLSRREVMGD
ncbi:trihelix transcription factor ASIL1-like isoform X2 [Phalaenopsis equestris]|uniref:trihelix transcription factor ASIL1-like isoform X2 n=1 Tax=Phalaenopsis equestris TaxID=78828 RepID=UPI0009E51AFF|nr:trihelix transcription factor ASIL1-like isoform X2 [Phalaenopsis equestris]